MANIIPSTWSLFANNGNQIQFLLPGHTVQKPRMCLFQRTIPSTSGSGPTTPAIRVRIVEGILDADGKPIATKISADVTIRNDVRATTSTVVADVVELGRLLSNSAFVTQMVGQQILPTSVPWDVV